MSAASDALGRRVWAILGAEPGLTDRKMFGGIAFMLHGNMVVAAMSTGELLVRAGPRYTEALERPGAHPMEMGARTMSGFVSVDRDAIEDDDEALSDWIDFALHFVRTLPPK